MNENMKNNSRTISANEINKFAYCPYQWYYERLYGRKRLRELELERNERLGLEDRRMSNMISGSLYHNAVKFAFGVGKIVLIAVIVCLVIAAVWLLKVKFNV